MARMRVGVLVSGRGSNMMALIEAAKSAGYPAEIALVISNRPDAAALGRAASHGIPGIALDHKQFADRESFDAEMQRHLDAHGIEFICLAGFMRVLSGTFVRHWQGRMINIHPSLLPLFKGLHTHQRAIDAGMKLAGASVHYVREELDDGPIIAQGAVPILPADTADMLAGRILNEVELSLYPAALEIACHIARHGAVDEATRSAILARHFGRPAACLLNI